MNNQGTNESNIQIIWLEPLRELLAKVCSPLPGKDGLALMMASLEKLESLFAKYRDEMPAQLVHFLERRSYDKAAQYCAGPVTIARGSCGGRE